MKKRLYKIIVISLIIALNWSGLAAVGTTLAAFVETETTNSNTWAAGSLDVSSSSGGDFSPEITPYQTATRSINIANDGSFDFDYDLTIENIGTDVDLCDKVTLDLDRNGAPIYSGTLAGFNVATSTIMSGGADDVLDLEITLDSEEVSLWLKTCSFDLVATGFQTDKMDASEGFSDVETINNNVSSDAWGVVMNEVLPDPTGADDALMPNGEWVEIYNNDSFAHDLAGWRIQDLENNKIDITALNTDLGTTMIAAGGYLVVYMNAEVLNNNGVETVILVDDNEDFQDVYTYLGPVPENKSNARIPDGTGDWVDPIPTPGSPNVANEEFDALMLIEMELKAKLAEEFMRTLEFEINPNLDQSTSTATSSPVVATSTPIIATSTPIISTSTPVIATSTLPTINTTTTPDIIESTTTPAVTSSSGSGSVVAEEPVETNEQEPSQNTEGESVHESETPVENTEVNDSEGNNDQESEQNIENQTTDPASSILAVDNNPGVTPDQNESSENSQTDAENNVIQNTTEQTSSDNDQSHDPISEPADTQNSPASETITNQSDSSFSDSQSSSSETASETSSAPVSVEAAPAPVPTAPANAPVTTVPALPSAPVSAPAVPVAEGGSDQ